MKGLSSGEASAGGARAGLVEQNILYTRGTQKAFLLCESVRGVSDVPSVQRNVDR